MKYVSSKMLGLCLKKYYHNMVIIHCFIFVALLYVIRWDLLRCFLHSLQKNVIYFKQFTNIYHFSQMTRYFAPPFVKYDSTIRDTILIIPGGAFIGDDLFDLFISRHIVKRYPLTNIITLDYKKNEMFDIVVEDSNQIIQSILEKHNITHVFAESAGACVALGLTKYCTFPKITFISPYLAWSNEIKSTDESNQDILLAPCVNYMKRHFQINIRSYIHLREQTKITVFVGSKELLLEDVLDFCRVHNITNIHVLDGYIHGLALWI